jgi:8-oxo-dGTP pyrophosphatase MutT (NUDIX family)
MRWTVHGERPLYADEWLDIRAADVELPNGKHLDHRLIRSSPGAGAAVLVDGRVLLIWRHRFITDTWGWEIPIGKIEPPETPTAAAAREVEEETGWRPGPLRPLVYTQPSNGISDSEHHIFLADAATHTGKPTEMIEADLIEWIPLIDVPLLIHNRDIVSGTSALALLYLLADLRG